MLPVLAQNNLDLKGLVDPALAKSVRIQRTVEFRVESGEIKLWAGRPMLVGAASANLER